MKKAILLFTFLLFSLQIVAQSKKEIIETLKIRIDSLHSEIKNRDINFEKAQALANSNKEALQQTISKLEQDIAFLKGQLDVTQKTNDKLVENNTQLTIRVAELKDSISALQQNIEAQEAQPIYSDFDKDFLKKLKTMKVQIISLITYLWKEILLKIHIIKYVIMAVCLLY